MAGKTSQLLIPSGCPSVVRSHVLWVFLPLSFWDFLWDLCWQGAAALGTFCLRSLQVGMHWSSRLCIGRFAVLGASGAFVRPFSRRDPSLSVSPSVPGAHISDFGGKVTVSGSLLVCTERFFHTLTPRMWVLWVREMLLGKVTEGSNVRTNTAG